MSTPPFSFGINKNSSSSDDRRSAMASSWIKRLCPETIPPNSIPSPFHLKSCFAPNNPYPPPPPRPDVVDSSVLVAGFGPFQVRTRNALFADGPSAGASKFLEYRRQLTTGIMGNLRPAHELIHGFPSQLTVDYTSAQHLATREGSGSRGTTDHQSATSSNFHNPHAFDLNTIQHIYKRQSYCVSSEPKEPPFSYWDMGRVDRKNFVSSVYPVTSSTMAPSRKRTANTYGFISSKFRRFHREG